MPDETPVRIAVVQAPDGHLTCAGPNDFDEGDHSDAMDAALCFHLEAGHLPVACYWITADIPAIPPIAELRAQAERGEIPKATVEAIDDL